MSQLNKFKTKSFVINISVPVILDLKIQRDKNKVVLTPIGFEDRWNIYLADDFDFPLESYTSFNINTTKCYINKVYLKSIKTDLVLVRSQTIGFKFTKTDLPYKTFEVTYEEI